MYCEIHEITHESDSCPVCYLMKFLANDQKRNFYEKFPAAQQSFAADAATPCAECGSSLPIVGGKYCGNCGTPRR